jgi:nicotinate phosphoribosyltransferase
VRTRIVVTGDLDEHEITALAAHPVDTYGVGTSVVTGSGAPTAGFVYKLVAVGRDAGPEAPLVPVAKRSSGKSTVGGRKWAYRLDDGTEVVRSAPGGRGRALQHPLPQADDVEAARRHCARALSALDEDTRRLDAGDSRPVQREDA